MTKFYQMSEFTILALLGLFYIGTFLISLTISKKKEDAEGYIVSNHNVGFGIVGLDYNGVKIVAEIMGVDLTCEIFTV